jgi:hypothetical protein
MELGLVLRLVDSSLVGNFPEDNCHAFDTVSYLKYSSLPLDES